MTTPPSSALIRFAQALREKFSTHISGEPEDQIRAPFEQLLRDAGAELGMTGIVPIGETLLQGSMGRPDYSVARGKLACGYVELKAPGKGANTALFTGHDLDGVRIMLNNTLESPSEILPELPSLYRPIGQEHARAKHVPRAITTCQKAVPTDGLPEAFRYDEDTKTIHVGQGEFCPVSSEVWNYEVSGLKVVQSWLGSRLKNRKGKKSSPLDDIAPKGWTSDFTSELLQLLNLLARTVAMHPKQAELLQAVLSAPLLKAAGFSPVPREFRDAPSVNPGQHTLTL
jgi:hypothetical protein